ncbi:MAG: tRNA pseudouridine(55) synthase TruB [Actinomycetota bacterium]|nr:tRNA pseudouridine(55) synthase TruB [Actinomycetota bacterium]
MTGADGVAVVDKPAGWTSHDVVARARRLLGTRRVGHAGTLDPDATGVLVLGVGRATRLLRYVTPLPKSYVGEVVLGVETTTLDAAGDVVATFDMGRVTLGEARAAAAGLVGDVDQVPPMVSAVRVGGRRLHELARQGLDVEREARRVTVHRFEVGGEVGREETGPVLRVEVDCSSGTYVRSLAADLGRVLGGGAHLRALRRTAVGPFTEDRARPVPDLEVLPAGEAVAHLAQVPVDDGVAALVATGTRLVRTGDRVAFPAEGPWAVTSAATGELLAVYEAAGERARPAVVLAAR